MTEIVGQVVLERRTELLNDQGTRWRLVATTSVLPGLRRPRRSKGSYPLVFRTLYGDVELNNPRLHRCPC